jgi:hypothetical protein
MRMRHSDVCDLPDFTLFFLHYLTKGTTLVGGGGGVTEHKTRVLIFCTNYFWNIFHSKENLAKYDQKHVSVCM